MLIEIIDDNLITDSFSKGSVTYYTYSQEAVFHISDDDLYPQRFQFQNLFTSDKNEKPEVYDKGSYEILGSSFKVDQRKRLSLSSLQITPKF